MAAIVAAAAVIAGGNAIPTTGQAGVGLEIAARNAANIAAIEVPTDPIGNPIIAVIRERVLVALN